MVVEPQLTSLTGSIVDRGPRAYRKLQLNFIYEIFNGIESITKKKLK